MSPKDPSEQSTTPSTPPPVVVVMVTFNAGAWFEEALRSLRDQDYANVATLIIDAGSFEDPLPKIAEVLPQAYVRRLSRNHGYSAAANRALRIVQGATHLVMCHDDVALAPDAVRRMVEEAYRTNAGLVTPKFVSWDDSRILHNLGGTADLTGAYVPAIEHGDLDQGQHDVSTEVFIAPGGCTLIRADLFESLGGFDAAMTLYGEDVDLSWRAQLAGARIVTCHRAVVRHVEASVNAERLGVATSLHDGGTTRFDEPSGDSSEQPPAKADSMMLVRRHRLRTILKVRRNPAVLFAALQIALITVCEIVWGIATGRTQRAEAAVAAWTWNIAHWKGLLKARRSTQRARRVSDKAINARLASTRNRLEISFRQEWGEYRDRLRAEDFGRELVGTLRNLRFAAWATVCVIWLLGSRKLLAGPLPAVGQFGVPLRGSWDEIRRYSGIWPGDFGLTLNQSPFHLLIAVGGIVFVGAVGVLQKALVLATLPVGAIGMNRLARPLQSQRARLLAVVAYAMVPLPYDALGLGRWDALVAYAAAPWILRRLLWSDGAAPYAMFRNGEHALTIRPRSDTTDDDDDVVELHMFGSGEAPRLGNSPTAVRPAGHPTALTRHPVPVISQPSKRRLAYTAVRHVLPLAIILAVAGSFAPQLVPSTILASAALTLGSWLCGDTGWRRLHCLITTALAVLVALVLLLPGIVGADSGWFILVRSTAASSLDPVGLGALFRFAGGGFSVSVATWGLFAAAIAGIALGRSWRFALATRLWTVVVVDVMVTWLSVRGWLGSTYLQPSVFLTLGAAALALAVGVTGAALTEDLRGYRFGWRQAFPAVTVAALVCSILPVAARAGDGSWGLASAGTPSLLDWMSDKRTDGDFRVLWLGDPSGVPGAPRVISTGTPDAGDRVGEAIALDGPEPPGAMLPPKGGQADQLLADAVTQAEAGNTVQLGHLLAPFGIRYVIVTRSGSNRAGGHALDPPARLSRSLESQLDFKTISQDPAYRVYENAAWWPVRTILPPGAVLAAHSGQPNGSEYLDLDVGQVPAVLPSRNQSGRSIGAIPSGEIYVAETSSPSWQLRVHGVNQTRHTVFGWATSFSVGSAGIAALRFVASPVVVLTQLANFLIWIFACFIAFRYRAARGSRT